MTRSAVIGGGVGGLAAARRLAQGGRDVVVFEGAPHVGGLASGFRLAGKAVERYYHHLFPHEREILELLDELGLSHRVRWFPTRMSVLVDGRVWPFTTPADLLRFAPMPPRDRVAAGIGALRIGAAGDWVSLDDVPALDWLRTMTTHRVAGTVWRPLLEAKFGPAAPQVPAAWMWGRLHQRAGARRTRGPELLGYLEGGFEAMFDALVDDLRVRGVDVRTATAVRRIVTDGRAVRGLVTDAGEEPFDEVVFTGPLPLLPALLQDALHDERWTSASSLGAVVIVLDLARPLTDSFWTNVCDPTVPFGGIIELTNLVPPEWFGGRNVTYLSRYFTAEEAIADRPLDDIAEEWLDAVRRVFPAFDDADIGERHVFRSAFAAPLVTAPYLPRVPPARSHINGLWTATTAQIYPADRGMSEGIRQAYAVADRMLDAGWACPVCRWERGVVRWAVPTAGHECGVDPELFAPSSSAHGRTVGSVVECECCGHASVADTPSDATLLMAYADAADPVSLREETGQVETAHRALSHVELWIVKGRMLDVGSWTGSLVFAAMQRGWHGTGLEPSTWAASRARERGVETWKGTLADLAPDVRDLQLVALCDVLEHLTDPAGALADVHERLADGGGVLVTVPDAGSRLARVLGRRWWSVLPMHVQYFTRESLRRLLESAGFDVVSMTTHAKVFSIRYYAERVATIVPGPVGAAIVKVVGSTPWAVRLVAPDFRDRLEVIAVKRSTAAGQERGHTP